jgi:hypothetical protein
MEIQTDFKELLELLNSHGVEYLIVGGYALALHGAPRYTGDMDIYVKADQQNARRILEALHEFGFASVGLEMDDFTSPDQIVQLGVPPVRIDLITSLSGVEWEEASSGSVVTAYGGVPVHILGRAEFVRNKKAVGRKQDLADIEAIGGETD